jgi:hypothetical protein
MRLLDATEIKLERLDLSQLQPHSWRPYEIPPDTTGVTTILRKIALTLGTLKLHPEDATEPTLMPWRMLMGMGWEAMCAQLYRDLVWQPKVLSCSGISGHPDGYRFISNEQLGLDEAMAVAEFKYTAKSVREKGARADQLKDVRGEWMWTNQVMCYLAMAQKTLPYYRINPDARLLGEFHIMWAMGAYEKYTLDERYMRYLVEFEQEEVDRAWAMIKNNLST